MDGTRPGPDLFFLFFKRGMLQVGRRGVARRWKKGRVALQREAPRLASEAWRASGRKGSVALQLGALQAHLLPVLGLLVEQLLALLVRRIREDQS